MGIARRALFVVRVVEDVHKVADALVHERGLGLVGVDLKCDGEDFQGANKGQGNASGIEEVGSGELIKGGYKANV
jgi:hypothetical protein